MAKKENRFFIARTEYIHPSETKLPENILSTILQLHFVSKEGSSYKKIPRVFCSIEDIINVFNHMKEIQTKHKKSIIEIMFKNSVVANLHIKELAEI